MEKLAYIDVPTLLLTRIKNFYYYFILNVKGGNANVLNLIIFFLLVFNNVMIPLFGIFSFRFFFVVLLFHNE